jgi:hypothetical protein
MADSSVFFVSVPRPLYNLQSDDARKFRGITLPTEKFSAP